jgi:hypothetical protein
VTSPGVSAAGGGLATVLGAALLEIAILALPRDAAPAPAQEQAD